MALDFSTLRKKMVLGPEHHQFQLIKPVSNSPIGQVWHAFDLSTGEDEDSRERVALEIVNPNLLKDTEIVRQFKTQIALSSRLDYKHVAKTQGYFQSREGWIFVAMEPVSTRSLARILIEDGYKQLNTDKARVILHQVALALEFLNKQKLSHGDLTPWNVIITHEVGVKLVNVAFRQPLLYAIQQAGHRVLNNEYHAPEAFGKTPLPQSTDLYSFACLIYLLLAGRAPFSPETPAHNRELSKLKAPEQFSAEQWQLLLQAFDDTPGKRPASALELLRLLFPPNPQTDDITEPVSIITADAPAAAPSNKSAEVISLDSGNLNPQQAQKVQQQNKGRRLISSIAATAIAFGAGLALGYQLTSSQYQSQQQQLLEQIANVQQLLQQPPSINSKIALSKEFASLKQLAPDSPLTAQLSQQVDNYSTRLSRDLVIQTPETEITNQKAVTHSEPSKQRFGEVFKDEIIPGIFGPEMITIPAGRFKMGDLDRNGDDNEHPVHEVVMTANLALSKTEVTFTDYDLFALSTGRPLPEDNGWGRGNRPVINISWNDANAYVHWIQQQTGQPYRLPSEAEWEYAARAGSPTQYSWGNEVGTNQAACDDCGSAFDGQKTAPTGSFPANAFGLHDMHGNVYEWVSDCYNENYDQAPADGSSWDVGQCNYRVMRSGSWYDIPRLIRSASRYRHPPNASRNTWGFRLALDSNTP
ncbi:MAG: SUMF1/EgtB/PvdO family nonheme iron enzyme [Motiliproteus sp.]